MSLYTRHKTTATDVNHVHPRLLAAGYWPGRAAAVEAEALARIAQVSAALRTQRDFVLNELRVPWTIATSDTDCDGTSFQAHRVMAYDQDDAYQQFNPTYEYDIGPAIPEAEFYDSPAFALLDDWSKQYYRDSGYISLGNTWS